MKITILAGFGVLAAAVSAQAVETAQCDSKPFTLKKPAEETRKPVVKEADKSAPKPAKIASAPPKPKPKPIADCDKPKG